MTSLTRLHDWPERLAEFIEGRRERPFSWGKNDCALFYADAVLAQTGVDIAKAWRGYKSPRAAASRIRRAGGMRPLITLVGCREKAVGFARYGDGVLAEMDGREAFGVVLRDGGWCGPGEHGVVMRPLADAIVAFEF